MPRAALRSLILLVAVLIVLAGGWATAQAFLSARVDREFDGERALEHISTQLSFGPRIPGTPGHDQIVTWIQAELKEAGWQVEVQRTTNQGQPIQNIIGRRYPVERPAMVGSRSHAGASSWIILGAHYDTRIYADNDPDPANHRQPVPGANDGASGVAVLLELARALPRSLDSEVWLVFFDAEDNGNIPTWDWILGSQAFVEHLSGEPDAVVIVDMVGDADLDLYLERNSTAWLAEQIWTQAAELGYDQFIPTYKHSILDDHTPFLRAGIPAVDIIDFDYPYWHTVEDTLDKVSAESLEAVGRTLYEWLLSR